MRNTIRSMKRKLFADLKRAAKAAALAAALAGAVTAAGCDGTTDQGGTDPLQTDPTLDEAVYLDANNTTGKAAACVVKGKTQRGADNATVAWYRAFPEDAALGVKPTAANFVGSKSLSDLSVRCPGEDPSIKGGPG